MGSCPFQVRQRNRARVTKDEDRFVDTTHGMQVQQVCNVDSLVSPHAGRALREEWKKLMEAGRVRKSFRCFYVYGHMSLHSTSIGVACLNGYLFYLCF